MLTLLRRHPRWWLAGAVIAAAIIGFGSQLAIKSYRLMPRSPLQAARLLLNSSVHAATSSAPAYSIYLTERETSLNGFTRDGAEQPPLNKTVTSRKIFARRSDGSTADYLIHDTKIWPADRAWDDSTIIDLQKHQIIHLFKFLNTKTTYPFAISRIQDFQNHSLGATPESDCLLNRAGKPAWASRDIRVVGHEQIMGFDSVHLTYDTPAEANGNHQKKQEWRATALGCSIVKVEITKFNSANQIIYETFHDPDKILAGDPDPSLFAPQADELKPSEELRRRKQYFFGRDATEAELSAVAPKDLKYTNAQQYQ